MLEQALASPNAELRKRLPAAGMAALGGAPILGVDKLIDLLSDENAVGRLAAVQALGQLGAKAAPAVDALLSHLDDPAMQLNIIDVLGLIGPAAAPAVPRLLELTKNRDLWETILPVFTEIGKGAKDALPMIYAALRDPSIDLRAAAVTALASVEPDASKALAVITPIAHGTETGKVHRAAVKALAKYYPSAAGASGSTKRK